MAKVQVQQTSSGFLPTTTWGNGPDCDREAYAMAYESLNTAERVARTWAEEQGAEYVAFEPVDHGAIRRQAQLVKQLRDAQGLDLPTAVARARAMIAAE